MSLLIEIPLKAIGFNNYQKSTRGGCRYTTQKGKNFEKELTAYLHKNKTKLRPIIDHLMKGYPNMIEFELNHYHTNYFKKNSKIHSKTCMDSDAPLKIIKDIIFKFLNADDYIVKKDIISKHPAISKDAIVIIINPIVDNDYKTTYF